MIADGTRTPAELVNAYIEEVERGEGIGEYERYMVERYKLDRAEASARGWWFDEGRANLACSFFPMCLKHTAGQWAGDAFHLLPWQCFIIWNLYGWRDASTKLRRFRKALIYVARKNGKTQLLAGLALKELWGHPDEFPEPEAEIYCAATKTEQAVRLWQAAHSMLVNSTELNPEFFHILNAANRTTSGLMTIKHGPCRGSYFKALGGDGSTVDSLSPVLVLRDELHEWRDRHRSLMEKLETGGGARQQPMILTISTAGDEDSDILNDELEFCQLVVSQGAVGEAIDDGVFAAIYKLDDDDDIYDQANWRKANPGLGITPSIKNIKDLAGEARNKPSMERTFRRYYCNLTTTQYEKAFPVDVWERGAQWKEFGDFPLAYAGIDMSKCNDMCSVAIVVPTMAKDGKWHYQVQAHSWCCNAKYTTLNYTIEPFKTWIAEGLLSYSTDDIIDTTPIKAYVREASAKFNFHAIYYDAMRCTELATELLNYDGLPLEDMPQGFQRYEPAIKEFLEALEDGRVYHDNDPCLAWQAGNAEWKYNHQDYRMVEKGRMKERKKVDAITAMLMAMSAAITNLVADQNDEVLVV